MTSTPDGTRPCGEYDGHALRPVSPRGRWPGNWRFTPEFCIAEPRIAAEPLAIGGGLACPHCGLDITNGAF